MEANVRKKAFSPNTLLGELSSWNRQEQDFKNIFSEQALHDRDYQKMKWKEYKRLSFKYSGIVQSTDQLALYKMLQFQERKMEKALYPNFLKRLIAKCWWNFINILKSGQPGNPVKTENPYIEKSIVPIGSKPKELQNKLEKKNDFKKIHGYDLGARVKDNQDRQRGQSL